MVQVALQIGAIEAEHRAGVHFYAVSAGVISGTPNDVAFEKALFGSVGEAAAALQKLGFIGGSGPQITYPGPGAIDIPVSAISRRNTPTATQERGVFTVSKLEAVTNTRLPRRTLFKGAGAFGIGLALDKAGFLPSISTDVAAAESLQDILNTTVTVEMFGVTILGVGLDSNAKGNFKPAWPDPVVAIVKAARAQEQAHLEFFQSLGGKALTQTFHVPDPTILTDLKVFFNVVQEEETREVAAQIAAMMTFTAMNRPDLVKVSF